MLAYQSAATSERRNAEWDPTPSPIPHTIFDQACINFVNSEFLDHRGSGRRYDRMLLPKWRRWFLGWIGLTPEGAVTEQQLIELKALRKRLRRLLEGRASPTHSDVAEFNRILAAAPLYWRLILNPSALQLRPVRDGWRAAMALVVHSYAELVTSGALSRVKRCHNRHCCYLFFDSTKGVTRRWCDPHMCGNLVKVRLYRSRREAT